MSRTHPFATAAIGVVAFLAQSGTAAAQTQPTPPEHYTHDERGVDLVTGQFVHEAVDVAIGPPDEGGIVHSRIWANGGWRDSLSGTIAVSGSTYVVSLGGVSEAFTNSGSTFTPVSNRGATLVQTSPTILTFTTSDGTVATYSTSYSGNTMAYQANNAALMSVRRPNGDLLTFTWDGTTYCKTRDRQSGGCLVYANATRINAVTSNRGYQINFTYASNSPPDAPTPPAGTWLRRTGAVGVNLAVDYCSPQAYGCTGLTRVWPSVSYASTPLLANPQIASVTDQSGRTTTYTYSGALTGIRFPGSATDDVSIAYASGRVSSVTGATGTWNYAYSDSGSTRTTTATGPLSQQFVAVSDQTIGRATSITSVLSPTVSNTIGYQYDSQRRLQRVTLPEGDYAQLTYDTRGNVTETRYTRKSGSPGFNIMTSAAYPATCANQVTCNLPTSTTDARGNVTEYTWDSTHGGLLTVTAPAPTTGAARPQTRITYAPQIAYYKNSSGVIAAAPSSVTLPVSVSSCATGSSCTGSANEVSTTTIYGSAGVANNLRPTSVSRGSGAAPSMSVTTMTYTADGDLETVDGPLPSAADTTRYRYDTAGQLVGVVRPDPDGAGAGLNRAQRLTYNPRGQVTLAETGTTVGYTDTDWANFSPLVRTGTTYDSYGRPVTSSQQSAGGAIISLQQVSYDAAGRVECTALRMNTSTYGSLPASACTAATSGPDGPDRITHYTYDAAGRPTSTTSAYGLAEAITESVTYTANGQVASLTDGEGNVSIHEYDGHDRPVRLRYPDPSGTGTSTTDYEEVGRDASGNVTSRRNRAGQITTIAYDNLNRPTAVIPPAGTMGASLTYDNLARVLTSTGGGQTLTNVWDPLSRLTSETGPLGTMSYQYDPAGAMTRITWPDSFYVQYDRDNYGAVTAIRENGAVSGAGLLAVYYYNNLGQTHMIGRGNGVTTTYGYDAWFRLNSLSHDAAVTANDVAFSYGLNPAGQFASRTVSNPAYVYAPVTGTTSYANDGLNRVTSAAGSAVTYDANQNIASALGTSYSYDAANRLTGTTGTSFTYDPADRLYSNSSAGVRYLYSGQQLVGEYNSSGVLLSRHIPGPGLDQTVASITSGTRYQQIADERQSVIGLSNASGGMAGINRYDEYGVPAPGNSDLFQYTGQIRLAPGLYHYRARAYAPQLGRFLQPDPIGYQDGTNIAAYVRGDPINLIDPSGEDKVCIKGTGSNILFCVIVAGDANAGNLTLAQKTRLSLAFWDFILANNGADLNGFGKNITFSGSRTRAEAQMARAVAQFVGYSASRIGGEFSEKWNGVQGVHVGDRWMGWSYGNLTRRNIIEFSARSGGLFDHPSDVGRIMIHETLHYGGRRDWLSGAWNDGSGGHRHLDDRACNNLNRAGLNGGVAGTHVDQFRGCGL